MKIRSILASCALAGAAALPALTGSAGAAATTSLTVVNGYQYSATNLLSATVCLDDQLVQPFGTTVINPTIDTTVGSHTLRLSPDNLPCSDTTASWIDTPVDLMAVPAQTLAIGWQAGTKPRTMNTWLFEDSTACVPAGKAGVVFRNIATYDQVSANFGETPTDVTEATALFSGVAVGSEDSTQLDAGRYPTAAGSSTIGWDPNDLQNPFVSPFTSLAGDAGTVTDIYAYGGNDGAVGLAKVVRQVGSCETPSTTTTVAPTTTIATQAQPATAVATKPTYTG